MVHEAFIVKKGDKYLRFGSYGAADPVDNPLSATIYTREADARKRLPGGAWTRYGGLYMGGKKVDGSLHVVKITVNDFVEMKV